MGSICMVRTFLLALRAFKGHVMLIANTMRAPRFSRRHSVGLRPGVLREVLEVGSELRVRLRKPSSGGGTKRLLPPGLL
ncbi:hypothetical protein BIW11_03054 [Tropilaelaps mercedesae]|uniref:Secreted protein n=1 Tax=Tropilaelaps mercedesae TaxID=418985 RepID=A0A1V9XT07_9ACAR|nr:hypothetical protein BIW11_03054 [Tropilaelaps mercedesae]